LPSGQEIYSIDQLDSKDISINNQTRNKDNSNSL